MVYSRKLRIAASVARLITDPAARSRVKIKSWTIEYQKIGDLSISKIGIEFTNLLRGERLAITRCVRAVKHKHTHNRDLMSNMLLRADPTGNSAQRLGAGALGLWQRAAEGHGSMPRSAFHNAVFFSTVPPLASPCSYEILCQILKVDQ
ncbi:hypothetical protein EVAR_48586_1 [Eumeta japonica]|uniref:Uncharacterized protein n=1 Tax=Eumeta variegata TaxID=151549 RepID=A0A4C1XFQ8_EUMVA|nr:hypothetical protein EVAR_48586_1 [Eumeta japonica]